MGMKTVTIAQSILAVLSGVLVISYGGADDSPGAQGIGLLTLIFSILIIVQSFRTGSKG
jgi:hypothetical protein